MHRLNSDMQKATLLSVLALVTALTCSSAAAIAQQSAGQTSAGLETRTFAAMGTIANIQLESGAPTWIVSGGWKLRASIDSGDNVTADFNAGTRMVRTDGTAMHAHRISDLVVSSWSENNGTLTFNGTVTITLRDGPKPGVPVSLSFLNGGAITIQIDSAVVDHFGTGPIYGVVLRTFDSKPTEDGAAGDSDGSDAGAVPKNGTETLQEGVTRSLVNYYPNATGYLAYPSNGTSLPALVMIHEWWGLNQNIKNEAEKLAGQGYAVLAVDLYDGRVATEAEAARTYSTNVRNNPGLAIENLRAAYDHLASLPNVNASRIASLGWCFGGGWSLQLALNSEAPLAATVIYYGTLVTDPETLATIEWPVLGIFGSEDQSIPVDTVRQFEAALDGNEIPNEIHIYEGVGHAFANPSGSNYAKSEAEDAWAKTLDFLRANV